MRALRVGAAYFAVVFALGFVLGAVRVTVLEPVIGPLPAVLLELPIMLAFAWFVCGVLVSRMAPVPATAERAAIGAIALALLLGGEFLLAGAAFGIAPGAVVAGWLQPAGALGLAGQVLFAVFPVLQSAGRAPSI